MQEANECIRMPVISRRHSSLIVCPIYTTCVELLWDSFGGKKSDNANWESDALDRCLMIGDKVIQNGESISQKEFLPQVVWTKSFAYLRWAYQNCSLAQRGYLIPTNPSMDHWS